jgi:hypothetical protein
VEGRAHRPSPMHKRDEARGGRLQSPRSDEDSQGKNRGSLFTQRTALISLAIIVGMTIGVVMSQRMYVESNRPVIHAAGSATKQVCQLARGGIFSNVSE